MIGSYKLIVFDLDGTLMDSLAGVVKSVQDICQKMGLEPPTAQDIRQCVGASPLEQVYRLFPHLGLQQAECLLEQIYQSFKYEDGSEIELFPEVEDTLRYLIANDYKLAIATGMSRRRLDSVLKNTLLGELITVTRSIDEARGKPDPDMMLQLLEYFNVGPSDALMVGDTAFDLELANNAHVQAIAVSYGAHSPEMLLQYKPIAIINSIAELTKLL